MISPQRVYRLVHIKVCKCLALVNNPENAASEIFVDGEFK